MIADLVVKVGGSLYDLPDLGPRLRHWLDSLADLKVILVPGGGACADAIRSLDRTHRLGEEASHWLALRVLGLHAHFLAALLPNAAVVERLEDCPFLWREGRVAVLDAHAFARGDEQHQGCLPHSWDVTSDSLAARVAVVARAPRLILLKAVTIPEGIDWPEAGRRAFVDPYFAEVVGRAVSVEVVNFRDWRPGR